MIIYKKEKTEILVPGTCICNNCGREFEYQSYLEGAIFNFVIDAGYSSSGLEDSARYKFDLCSFCLKKIFSKFKVKIEEEDIDCCGEL